MSRDTRFWRNVALIALAHLAVVLALARASRDPQKPNVPDIVWMNTRDHGSRRGPRRRHPRLKPGSKRLHRNRRNRTSRP